jgi:PAS domain S-box-containing protein
MEKLKFLFRYIAIPFALLTFFFVFYLVYNDIKERTINEFNNEQLVLARTASQGITSFFDDCQSNLTFLSQFKGIIDFTEDSKTLMANYFENHKSILAAITRVDASGIILYTYPYNQSVIGTNISHQKHVQQVIATHQTVLSDVFMSAQGYLAIAMHVPVFNEKNYVGSLAILIPIDKLGEMYLGKIKIRGTGSAWLLSEKGIELYCAMKGHTGESHLSILQNESSAVELLEKIKLVQSGTTKSYHQEVLSNNKTKWEEKYIAFYRAPLVNTYWTILISCQGKDIYNEIAQLRNRLILIFSLLSIIILFYFFSLVKARNVLKEESRRKKVEKTLMESEEKFRKIFEDYSAVKLLIDPKTNGILDANKYASEFYGWSIEELKQMKMEQINTLTANEIREEIEKVLTDKKIHFEFRHRLKNGSVRDVEVFSCKIKIGDKDVLHSIVHDITERKQVEEALRESETRFRKMVEQANIAMAIVSMEGVIEFINNKAIKVFGYLHEDIPTMDAWWLKAYPDEGYRNQVVPDWMGRVQRAIIEGNEIRGNEFLVTCKDGSIKTVFISGVPVSNKIFVLFDDITERKKAEIALIKEKERAEESDRLKTAFLQNMSHEIRTPMNAIMGFSSLLVDNYNNKPKLEQFSEIINQRCNDLLEIINDILDISKIESGQLLIHNEECNLNELFSELTVFFKEHQKRIGKQQILFNLQASCDHSESNIVTDKVKLRQIFINLIGNAFKFTDSGKIEGGCKFDANGTLVFFVSDTGIGIPADKQEVIFERFAQLSQNKKYAFGGTGLGLSIVKGLVGLLGGKIWIESEQEDISGGRNGGTTFYFSFPIKMAENAFQKQVPIGEAREYHFNDKTILVVEDDPYNTAYLKEILSDTGLNVIITEYGHEAVRLTESLNPDLVLMDIRLPDMDGNELARKIKQIKPDLRIIAQTAYAAYDDKQKAFEAGCIDYIIKPFKRELLLSMIFKYLPVH